MNVRTDLAIEAKRLWDKSMQEKTELSGVVARQSGYCGIPIDIVEIINDEGAKTLKKPIGTYVTVNVSAISARERSYFQNAAEAISRVMRTMMEQRDNVLVVGLGNQEITPDAIGPVALQYLIVTRHLRQEHCVAIRNMASVSAIAPGVLGSTGIESLDLVRGAVRTVEPQAVIVIDALASCEPDRLCTTVQITDTGIVPGSGVGNRRHAFTQKELGVPVYSIGVPTIADADSILAEKLEKHEKTSQPDLIMTPRNIDFLVKDLSKLVGYGINLSLHPQLEFDDIPSLLS